MLSKSAFRRCMGHRGVGNDDNKNRLVRDSLVHWSPLVRDFGISAWDLGGGCMMGSATSTLQPHPPPPCVVCGLWDPIPQGSSTMRSLLPKRSWQVVSRGWLGAGAVGGSVLTPSLGPVHSVPPQNRAQNLGIGIGVHPSQKWIQYPQQRGIQ